MSEALQGTLTPVKAATESSEKILDLAWKFEQAHLKRPFSLLSAVIQPSIHSCSFTTEPAKNSRNQHFFCNVSLFLCH